MPMSNFLNTTFQCSICDIFYVEFHREPLKFHTEYLTHTLEDVYSNQRWKFEFLWPLKPFWNGAHTCVSFLVDNLNDDTLLIILQFSLEALVVIQQSICNHNKTYRQIWCSNYVCCFNKDFHTWHQIGCQPIRSHARKSLSTNRDFAPDFFFWKTRTWLISIFDRILVPKLKDS